jgi:hypothetical protein
MSRKTPLRPEKFGRTTGETTSHPTKQPEDGCQVVGYSHLTKLAKGFA